MLKRILLAALALVVIPATAAPVVKSWQIDKPLTVQRPARKPAPATVEVKYSVWVTPSPSPTAERQWTILKSETLNSGRPRY